MKKNIRRAILTITALIFLSPPALSAEGLSNFMGGELGQRQINFDYQTEYMPQQDLKDASGDLSLWRQRIGLSLPLWQNNVNELALEFRGGLVSLDTDARLPKSGVALPDELWSLDVGLSYRHKFANSWILGMYGLIGSHSDKLFANSDTNTFGGTAWLRIPSGNNSWYILLNYDGNRDLWGGVPIPGAAYHFKPSDDFSLLLGFPFAFAHYRPTKDLSLSFSYIVPNNISFKTSYALNEIFTPYVGYTWDNQRFFLADRADKDHRLFYYEMRTFAGLNIKLPFNLGLDFSGGYAFDRQFFQGEDYSDRDQDRLKIEDGWFVKAEISFRF